MPVDRIGPHTDGFNSSSRKEAGFQPGCKVFQYLKEIS
jgi:hypothetical protein